jgi:hypothetical protein
MPVASSTPPPPSGGFACTSAQNAAIGVLLGGDKVTSAAICATIDVSVLGPDGAVLKYLVAQQLSQANKQLQLTEGLDTGYVLLCAVLVRVCHA